MQNQHGGFKLDTRTIVIILVVIGVLFVIFRGQAQRAEIEQAATQQALATETALIGTQQAITTVTAAAATAQAVATQEAEQVRATAAMAVQATTSASSAIQLGQLVTALSVDRDGCSGEVTTRFAPDDSIFVVARETDIPQGTAIFARLYFDNEAIEDTDEIVADSDLPATCINFVFENNQGFEAGSYEAEFFVNGNSAGSVAFTVG